jgi:tripartite-type tricarboxylate transporter receptor subunit TctC
MNRIIRRRTVLAGLAAAPFAAPAIAQQGNWPERLVKVIVPWPAGGSTDVLTRLVCERLHQKLGQPFVVENKSGAAGNIGVEAAAKSPPDGYTLGVAAVGHWSINQYLYSKLPWDIDRDFVPVSVSFELPNVAVVPAQHNASKTLAEFIAWAKAKKNGISYGSPGIGTTPHLSGALLASRAGYEATHVPFRGAAQTIPAMLAGDVDFALDNLASYIGHIQQGQMRALAVTSAKRFPSLPDVPTMAEAGMKDFVITSWHGYVFPTGTPKPIVEKLNAALAEGSRRRRRPAGAFPASRRLRRLDDARGTRRARPPRAADVAGGGAPLWCKGGLARPEPEPVRSSHRPD